MDDEKVGRSRRITLISNLSSHQDDLLLKEIASSQGWHLIQATSWVDLTCCVQRRETGVILISRAHLDTDWCGCLSFLLQPEHRCCVLLAAVDRAGCFHETFLAAGGYDVVNLPLLRSELVTAVERAWSSWNMIHNAYGHTSESSA